VELFCIDTPSAANAAWAFEMAWLFRYPHPVRVIHDQGNEFQGMDFQILLQQYVIEDVPTSVQNPQANAVCEQMHQVVGNILRTLLHSNPPANLIDVRTMVEYCLATASYSLHCTANRALGVSPGAVVFHRDMLIDGPYVANLLLLLREKRQAVIDDNLQRENNQWRNFDYVAGQQVLELVPDPANFEMRTKGPYRILQVHTNGTVTIERAPGLRDRVNIRRARPFLQ
jgi:transposase InsO family protein